MKLIASILLVMVLATQAVAADPINTNLSDVYVEDGWSFTLVITAPKSRSEGTWGILMYQNQTLGYQAKTNDYHETPWGRIYWWGMRRILQMDGHHFWYPEPNPKVPIGKELDPIDDGYKK
jgi:hypothetical protein